MWSYIGVILGLLYRVILGLYWHDGKQNGNYYIGLDRGYTSGVGFRVGLRFRVGVPLPCQYPV